VILSFAWAGIICAGRRPLLRPRWPRPPRPQGPGSAYNLFLCDPRGRPGVGFVGGRPDPRIHPRPAAGVSVGWSGLRLGPCSANWGRGRRRLLRVVLDLPAIAGPSIPPPVVDQPRPAHLQSPWLSPACSWPGHPLKSATDQLHPGLCEAGGAGGLFVVFTLPYFRPRELPTPFQCPYGFQAHEIPRLRRTA